MYASRWHDPQIDGQDCKQVEVSRDISKEELVVPALRKEFSSFIPS